MRIRVAPELCVVHEAHAALLSCWADSSNVAAICARCSYICFACLRALVTQGKATDLILQQTPDPFVRARKKLTKRSVFKPLQLEE